jgi:hypothetical protein
MDLAPSIRHLMMSSGSISLILARAGGSSISGNSASEGRRWGVNLINISGKKGVIYNIIGYL